MILGFIPMFYILYIHSKTFIMVFYFINFIIASVVYYKATKNYFPRMRYSDEEKKKFQEINGDGKKKQYFHEDYPSFNRIELSNLSFGKIYFGFLNYFWLKAILGFLSLFAVWLSIKLKFYGRSIQSEYGPQDRNILKDIGKNFVTLIYKSLGVYILEKNLEEDEKVLSVYRKYLGPNYDPKVLRFKYTTVISNHVCWVDILYLMSKISSSFVAKESVKSVPLVGYIAEAYKTLYIDRNSRDARKDIIEKIEQRQNDIMRQRSLMPIIIFPEGTTSNGRNIIQFKKGAFYSLSPVKIFILKVDNDVNEFPLAASGMSIFLHLCLSLTFAWNKFEAIELPVVEPTDYMYENFKHFGKEKAAIFSEICRHIMSEIGELPLSDSTYETKLNYMSEVNQITIKST